MAQPIGGLARGTGYVSDWTNIGQSALDPVVGGYAQLLNELERLKMQRQNIGLASSLYGTNYGEGKGSLLFPSAETPDYMLSRQQREDRDLLDIQIAALESRAQELVSLYPFLQTADRKGEIVPNEALLGGDWQKALAVEAQRQLAGGESPAKVNQWLLTAQDNLASGRAAGTEDAAATQRAMELLPAWAQRMAEEAAPTGAEPVVGQQTDAQAQQDAYNEVVLTTQYPWLAGITDPVERAAAISQIGQSGLAGLSATASADTGYNEQALAQAEQIRQSMQQQQIERDVLSGVLGGLAPSGAISPQNIQDYVGEQGVYGDITRAYYNQLTGNPSPWQMQQWEAQQAQVAADNAYRQQSLAQQAAYQQAMLEQQRREMAAQIGAQVASMANQSYMDTLGQRLPAGTQYAPGFGPTGAMASLAGMSGLPYQATQIGVANPPTTDELMKTVQDAISRF